MSLRPLRVALAAALAVAAGTTVAQVDPLTTTAGLRAACESRPGNSLTISTSITVNQGYPAGYPEPVATGCAITLTNGASIQFDKVGMAFAGPLIIGGGAQSGVTMQEASLAAPTVTLKFTTTESFLQTSFSRIDATAGDLKIELPGKSKMELFQYRTGGVPLTRATLAATGAVSIVTTNGLSAALIEAGIVAGGNLSFLSRAQESSMKVENSGLHSFNGNVAMRMQGSKSNFEFSNSSVRAPLGNLSIATTFNESAIGLSNVTLEAGVNATVNAEGSLSKVEISNGSMVAGGALLVAAAPALGTSSLKVDNGAYRGGTPVRFLTGPNGSTGVYGAAIQGSGHVRIATGAGGNCEALLNRITSLTQAVCQ
jgi:hypothetical protein